MGSEQDIAKKLKILSSSPDDVLESPKCADCKIKCAYRDIVMNKNRSSVCPIPIQRKKAIETDSNILFLDSDHVHMLSSELVILVIDYLKKNPSNIGMATILLDKLIRFQQVYYPATQKSVNINMDFSKQLAEFQKIRRENLIEDAERKANLAAEKSRQILTHTDKEEEEDDSDE